MTAAQNPRDAARAAAVTKLNSIYSGQVPERVARDIADAAVDAFTTTAAGDPAGRVPSGPGYLPTEYDCKLLFASRQVQKLAERGEGR